MTRSSSRRRRGLALFEAELSRPDEEVDVIRAALYIAMHHTPRLDVDACVAQLEEMSAGLEAHLPPPDERYTRRMLLAINSYMFGVLGFKPADKATYYSVEMSCLDAVLAQRRGPGGIPLVPS